MQAFFTKDALQFLVELKFNNERQWFLANKPRYEAFIKKPAQTFLDSFVPRLKKINSAYDSGRLLRIYRDVRFSKDKTPYKTSLAFQFSHRATGGDAHLPGFFLHIEPGESFIGAGLWAPESDVIKKVRAGIMARPQAWAPLSTLNYWGDSFVRPPKGVDPGHRFINDLKRKHFMSWIEFSDKTVLSPDFGPALEKACKKLNPLVLFLNAALGLK